MALVSIIMPAYNSVSYIGMAIDSVINQEISDWELIIVDDCSSDGTYDFIHERYSSESRIKLHRLDKNSGSPAAPRNFGLRQALGRYIAFLDADDLWRPDKLSQQLHCMTKNGAVISCTAYSVIDANGKLIGSFYPPERNNYSGLLKGNTIGCLTLMYDRNAFGELSFPKCGHEDYALWLSMLRAGNSVIGIQRELADYRIVSGSVSSNKLKMLSFFWNIYHNMERFSLIRSAFYCIRYAMLNSRKYH
ncbi:glycosyltransferase family 2 protein [Pseudomonas sp. QE6]|uniref:glycosyltransferase family 2 protein n=1 Tax=Pseudomonas sp. QE6 TaxID=3242491 RepID=UPI0035282296